MHARLASSWWSLHGRERWRGRAIGTSAWCTSTHHPILSGIGGMPPIPIPPMPMPMLGGGANVAFRLVRRRYPTRVRIAEADPFSSAEVRP